jgi:hypothetical protein
MSEAIRLSMALAAGGIAATIVGVGVLVGVLGYLVMPEPRPRAPSKRVVVEETQATWATRRLVSNVIRSGNLRGEVLFDGIRVTADWVVDFRLPLGGYYWVAVGEHESPASNLEVVHDMVHSRLAAIRREQLGEDWAEPAFVRGGGVA